MTTQTVFRIVPTTQQYDWGKVGLASKVAQLVVSANTANFSVDHSKSYAELWMGTHPSSPSSMMSSGIALSAHLAANPQLVGAPVLKRFSISDGSLPFLFKVLSIQKALSIQAHPDKHKAEQLHASNPLVYKDANHKPELAIALTPFSALCGFLPEEQINQYLNAVPEFAALILATPPGVDFKLELQNVFSSLMTAEPQLFIPKLRQLVARYRAGDVSPPELDAVPLVLNLYSQFPDDIGVFCPYVMNHIKLQPGESIFLGAGEPHAYISGDIMECMANSDNVLRAGLTPKPRDVPNLLTSLSYLSGDPMRHVVQPVPFEVNATKQTASTMLYKPPTPEFSVLRTTLASGCVETHRPICGPSIMVVLEGSGIIRSADAEGLEVTRGHVLFVGEGTAVQIEASGEEEDELIVYRAFVEVDE